MRPYSFSLCCSVLLVVIASAGCAWIPQTAHLKVEPFVAPSNDGRGAEFAVEVLDRRMTTTLGYRGVDSQNATITSKQNIAVLVRDALLAGFAKKGFQVKPHEGEAGLVLTVELAKLDYTTDMDFWKGVVMTEAVLNAKVVKNRVRFEQVYTGHRNETTIEAPRAKTNERLLNEAITKATRNLLEDPDLVRFLAE